MSEEPVQTESNRHCVYCGTPLAPRALICAKCERAQLPRPLARLAVSPLTWLVQALGAGAGLLLISVAYQSQAERIREYGDRAEKLANSSVEIQVLAEELQRPCPHGDRIRCRVRYHELVANFSEATYAFKQEGAALAGSEDVRHAVGFVDDFFNPPDLDLASVDATPLQIRLLASSGLMGRPYDARDWCSPETQRQLQQQVLSINVYRYCYITVRNYFKDVSTLSVAAPWSANPAPLRTGPRYELCTRPVDEDFTLVDKINTITERILDSPLDFTAPWNHEAFCPPAGTEARGWSAGVVPADTRQLLVVTSADWDAPRGKLQRLSRTALGGWVTVGDPFEVALGKKGLGWGRGLHTSSVSHSQGEGEPVKAEGDSRAPAGVFSIGEGYATDAFDDVLPGGPSSLRLEVQAIGPELACEDRVDRGTYNQIVGLTPEEWRACDAAGRCPEGLKRDDGVYDFLLWIDHNRGDAAPGAGSCIFLHVAHADGRSTAGCTALARPALAEVAQWLDPAASPLLVQLPRATFQARARDWGLPEPTWLETDDQRISR